ncbi:uncharacterized protein CIMG_03778 [Coccidioides immitis RS]|uniref:Uncharacterized protein n=1 Tax=Coccidioides immitis (strain RS) TaxID=246410 RepID=J3KC34_COCIM|nr:uncharacterized protein CIMG_03778 [Coccidioides immitis RS]EAS32754.3 hypothetical protein CIMG_03778 [Coccidioides immitis RS]
MAAISNTSAAVKYPWDPATPLTARSTCSIFLPPSLELLPVGPTSNSSSSTTTTVATPLTARSTCSIFEFKTPSSTEWMWAKCSLGVGSVVPRVVVPSNPRSSSGRQGPKNKEPQKCEFSADFPISWLKMIFLFETDIFGFYIVRYQPQPVAKSSLGG